MKKILIVVDMLNDFIRENGALFCGPTALAIVDPVSDLVASYRANGWPIIFLADAHDPDDKEFDRFPPHCVEGTTGAAIISELNPVLGADSFVTKTRYSGFYGTPLDNILSAHYSATPENTTIEVCGVCTSICVMDTVGDLANRDYATRVRKDCVADFDQEMHEMALKRMENLYGTEVI
jgi:nicotinamidase/pyrazinamidase